MKTCYFSLFSFACVIISSCLIRKVESSIISKSVDEYGLGFHNNNSSRDDDLNIYHNDSSSDYDMNVYHNGSSRESKFFPFFSIIRFANAACTGPSSFDGTCFTRRECNDIGGSYSGTCASRRGVCCVVQMTCGNTTNVNNTYFTNSEFPNSFAGGRRCSIFVQRCNSGVCQLRIDMLEFSLAQPDGDGNCVSDALVVTGGGSTVPRICGENSGQHVYVDFNADNIITISIDASAATAFNRRWNIKLTQTACNCPTLAPSGCLQYYTGLTGTVRSFNFGTAANTALSAAGLAGTRHMVSLNYGVCIRRELGYCSLTWAQSGLAFSFTLIGDVDTGGVATTTCDTDYIIIPNNVDTTDRFCVLPTFTTLTTTTLPFVLYVVTDADEGTDVANRGFALTFTQVACDP